MMQVLLEQTGNPVIDEIVSIRKSYWHRLLASVAVTTSLVGIWVGYILLNTSSTPAPSESLPMQTVAYEILPLIEVDPSPVKRLLLAPTQAERTDDSTAMSQPSVDSNLDTLSRWIDFNVGYLHILPNDSVVEKELPFETDTTTLKRIHVVAGYQSATIKQVLFDIGSRTGLFFTFPDNALTNTPHISLEKKDRTVHQLLMEVLTRPGLEYAKIQSSVAVAVFKPL